MYPAAELNALARRKAILRARISLDRLRMVALSAEVVRPINWLDRVIVQWRKISPFAKFAALPLGLLLNRAAFGGKKPGLVSRALRFVPVILGAVKLFQVRTR
ncbi:MAG: hypothetical protein ABIV50_10580 [Opitutus sp.]